MTNPEFKIPSLHRAHNRGPLSRNASGQCPVLQGRRVAVLAGAQLATERPTKADNSRRGGIVRELSIDPRPAARFGKPSGRSSNSARTGIWRWQAELER